MRIVVVGCLRNRERIAEVLKGLGYVRNPNPPTDMPENLFTDVGNLREAECRLMKYDPVDVLVADAIMNLDGGAVSVSWQEARQLFQNVHRGYFAKVKMVMTPMAAADSELSSLLAEIIKGARGKEMKRKVKILVVEDNPNMRELVLEQLADLGYDEVKSVENCRIALGSLGKEKFDLLITDRETPGMLGEELIRHARQTLQLRLPIIFMTGNNEPWVKEVAREAGADAFLLKPLDIKGLQQAIQDLCGGAQ